MRKYKIAMDKFEEIQNLNLSYGKESKDSNLNVKDSIIETSENIKLKSFYTADDIMDINHQKTFPGMDLQRAVS